MTTVSQGPGGFQLPELPVSAVLEDVAAALARHGAAVLVAPPGAGKTTLVPLHLLAHVEGRIILLEPRRVAARAAARRMAALSGGEVGGLVGQAMRLDTKQSAATRVLIVTEGVFARMALADPELPGIGAVIFDEFHERSLDADFGLALALDIRRGLRPDLKLLVMSATLDGVRMAAMLGDAPLIESRGRAFPVVLRHRDRRADERIEDAVASTVREALAQEEGSVLAFLPGVGEIARTARLLEGRLPAQAHLHVLHGQLDGRAQDAAIRPPELGTRKVVLATSIAESALTIDGVRVVIDSGLARVPVFDPSSGLTHLETVRVSRAAADQRAGRAGRTQPGVAIRLWHEGQTAALPAHDTPEIRAADLSSLVMDCAAFGVTDPAALPFPEPPPPPAIKEARALLQTLGALDATGRLTALGEKMRAIPLPARLAAMVARASPDDKATAALLAVLITERGVGGPSVDLAERLVEAGRDGSERARRAKDLAARIGGAGRITPEDAGPLLLHAFPDRVAMRRGGAGRLVMANGRGAEIAVTEALARQPFLVIADLQGRAQNARITAAAAVAEIDIRTALKDQITSGPSAWFDPVTGSLKAEERDMLGRLVLARRPGKTVSGASATAALLEAVRDHGLSLLPWSDAAIALRARLGFLHSRLPDAYPDVSDEALLEDLDAWLAPWLAGRTRFSELQGDALQLGLMGRMEDEAQRRVRRLAPHGFILPTGSEIALDYRDGDAVLAVRVQELFGLKSHPAILDGRFALLLELLSPAHRPIQTTRDLPSFWAGSWKEVRAEMRGRYPRHVWPDDPANAEPTRRAKPRGT
jgi:ATP-dependent helicase HrpB